MIMLLYYMCLLHCLLEVKKEGGRGNRPGTLETELACTEGKDGEIHYSDCSVSLSSSIPLLETIGGVEGR